MVAMVLFTSAQPPSEGQGVLGRQGILGAIQGAARSTGVDFAYLLKTAKRESALDPTAKAETSSATGLFQFIDQTWLQTLKLDGPALGLSAYADQIERTESGRYVVRDDEMQREILGLRANPDISALMAGAFTRRNNDYLANTLGRQPSPGELYIAHFMGAGGAADFIRLAAENPDEPAASAFPAQARANRSIFYARNGEPLAAAAVYDKLVRGYGEGTAIDGEIAPAELAGTVVAGLDPDTPLPADPGKWMAIPARNAYAIEARRLMPDLGRSQPGSPTSDHVTVTWARLGKAPAKVAPDVAGGTAPTDLARTVTPVAADAPLDLAGVHASGHQQESALPPPDMPVSRPSIATEQPGSSLARSIFQSLFSVQPNAPFAGG